MDREYLRESLLRKDLEELYQLRGELYTSKEELVEDIIANDDGSVAELIELEGSFMFLLMGRRRR